MDSLQTPDAQWAATPYGEHFWAPIASAWGVKLTNLYRPGRWRDRELPLPNVRADRDIPAPGIPLVTLRDIHVVQQPEHLYAFVYTGAQVMPCQAQAQGGNIDVVCTSDTAGTLVVRENTWTGWKAWRDGERVPLKKGTQWLSIQALAGEHIYSFRYRPWDVWVGLLLTLTGILLAMALWWPGLVARIRGMLPDRDYSASPKAQ
jgi:hypothetical protein